MSTDNISTELFTNNSYIKSGKICLGIFATLNVVAGAIITLNGNSDFLSRYPGVLAACGMIAVAGMVAGLSGLILLVKGIAGRKKFNAFIAEYGEDAFMSEITNDTLYTYSRKDKPITIITRKHIFEVGGDIVDPATIDYAYGYSYKGSTSIHAYTLDNKLKTFATGIPLRGDEIANVFQALKSINSDVLIGFTHENNKEHKARVKEHKQSRDL